MKPCLVDVNVFLALLVRYHVHHRAAKAWFDRLARRQAALCRLVQLSVVRLLCNRSIMADRVVPALRAFEMLAELREDERLEFVAEPPFLDDSLYRILRYSAAKPKLISDAYLAAFAVAGSLSLVTFDKGFRDFIGLDLILLPE